MITTAIHSEPIDLGRQGENLARTIEIDISAWRAEHGEGTVQLLHQRQGDSTPYPAAVEQVGDVVRWAITSADTARVGYGAAQLLFFAAGDVLAKQCIYRTYVSPSLGQSAGEPPEAQQPWVERVLAEAAKVTGMTARAVELPAGADPTADYADGILTIGIPLGGEVSEAQVAQAVADYLAAHPIKESDPTVPDWAKQPNKPSYSADEVGAIAQTELQAAVDTALAQAKASGAFDGAPGSQGEQGPQGKTGVGIQSVEQTTTSTEDGGTNIVTVTKTDGTSSTFQVKNGSKGSTGPTGADGTDGAPGADGQDGTTPTIGDNGNWYIGDTDTGKPSRGEIGPAGADGTTGADGKSAYAYAVEGGYTGTELEFKDKLAAEKFVNPYALTFAGAVTGSYDGSEALTVEIPSGGGGSNLPIPTAEDVGKVPVVQGDLSFGLGEMGGGDWEVIADQTLGEEAASVSFDFDVTYRRLRFIVYGVPASGSNATLDVRFNGSLDKQRIQLSNGLQSSNTSDGVNKRAAQIYLEKINGYIAFALCSVNGGSENPNTMMYSPSTDSKKVDWVDISKVVFYAANTSFSAGSIFKLWGCK